MSSLLQGTVGDLSQGKTLAQTFMAKYVQETTGAAIYSNYRLNFPHTYIRNLEQFEKAENCYMVLDEIWSWLDSYRSQERSAQVITHLLLKAGKRGCTINWSAQDSRQVAPRLYRITNQFLLPLCHDAVDAKGRPLLMNGQTFPETCDLFFADKFLVPVGRITFRCPPIFSLYDTHEEILPLEGLERFKAAKALKDYRDMKKAEELGLNLSDS
jgi:hypothetical protein